ncbi:hypothetical protein CRM22_001175 [Opisthorchis felineus]|uniref:Menin n=1 Tax=Opisthorchis felineus TaxID=147828 RepID=A0A4V3SGX7_OPIFE|nr:hypothetical protein CRM22_001175 [Opisthorchis felineus]
MTLRGGQSTGSIRTWRRHFPLSSVNSVVDLMREILTSSGFQLPLELDTGDTGKLSSSFTTEISTADSRSRSTNTIQDTYLIPCVIEPDLAFVSIVLGFIENHLTVTAPEEANQIPKSRPPTTLNVSNSRLSARLRTSSNTATKIPPSPLSVHNFEAPDLSSVAVSNSPNLSLPEDTGSLSSSSSISASAVSACDNDSNAGQTNDLLTVHRSRRSSQTSHRKSRVTPRRRVSSQSLLATADTPTPFTIHEPLHVVTDSVAPSLVTSGKKRRFSDSTAVANARFPCLTFEEAEKWYQDFYALITTSPKLQPFMETKPESKQVGQSRFATRGLIRAVCEVLRSSMSSGKGKEKLTHTQSIYSFLTTGLLDSFGLAYTTVAACQLLGYSDVDLALSEEHGWVEFGPPDARQSADVATWMHNAHLGSSIYESTGHSDTRSRASPTVTEPSESKPSPLQDRNEESDEAINPPPIRAPPLIHSWLYVNGFPVVCRPRILAVTAAVAALQPGACLPAVTQAPTSAPITSENRSPIFNNSCSDLVTPDGLARHLSSSPAISMQLVTLKHRLLWLFFEAGCLNRYPLGLTNLADLEDAFPSAFAHSVNGIPIENNGPENEHCTAVDEDRQASSPTENAVSTSLEAAATALKLYNQAVAVTNRHYANQHVYPYTCLAGCLYRHGDHRGALHYWSKAAEVIGQYNHSSEDLEIYRELLEIATQLMPHMFRSAAEASRSCSEGLVEADPDGCLYQPANILDDPQCLAYLLAFYDHLCLWEEGSPVPVLHVGWVDKLMVNLARFSRRARRLLVLSVEDSRQAKNEDLPHSPMSKRSDDTSVCSPSLTSKRSSRRTRNTYPGEGANNPISSAVVSVPSPSFSVTSQALTVLTPSPPVDRPTNSMSPLHSSLLHDKIDRVPLLTRIPNTLRRQKSKVAPSVSSQLVTVNSSSAPSAEVTESSDIVPTGITDMKHLPSAEVAEVLARIYQEPDQHKADLATDIEEQDGSPSPPPLIDFPNHDDFLTSLVEVCDQRLLNPAFLWGVEPHLPFLPADVAPEEAFTRLLASLESKPSLQTSVSLFPTPPNSGSVCDSTIQGPVSIGSDQKPTEKDPLPAISATETKAQRDKLDNSPSHSEKASDDMRLLNDFEDLDDPDLLVHEVPSNLLDTMTGFEREFKLDPLLQESTTGSDELLLSSIMKSETDSESSPRHSSKTSRSVAKTMDELLVHLTLHSTKMISIVELLRAQRLNSSAIKLALTAQSQVCLRRTGLSSLYEV